MFYIANIFSHPVKCFADSECKGEQWAIVLSIELCCDGNFDDAIMIGPGGPPQSGVCFYLDNVDNKKKCIPW